jgi:hypothetical protein
MRPEAIQPAVLAVLVAQGWRKSVQNGGKSPSTAGRRHRTYFVVRCRYKRARWVAAGGGVFAVAIAVAMRLSRLEETGLTLGMDFYVGTIALLLAGAAAPWLIVEGLWRWTRRRHFWDWQ